jgi:hypothetical protein
MKFTEWASTSLERQREIIVQLRDDGRSGEYMDMAMEAAKALKIELVSIPEVTGVDIGGGRYLNVDPLNPMLNIRELTLIVYTLFRDSYRLNQIPSRFGGFIVEQLNLGAKRDSYIRTWIRLFKELRGWDESKTVGWAKQWDDALSGRTVTTSVMYEHGPVKVALPALIDRRTKEAAGARLQFLYQDIQKIVERIDEHDETERIEHPDTVENYDWEHVRKSMAESISRHTS